MTDINLIKRKKRQVIKKRKTKASMPDLAIGPYDYGPTPPSQPDVGSIWLNTNGGSFYIWNGDDWEQYSPDNIDFDSLDIFDPVEAYDRAMGVV